MWTYFLLGLLAGWLIEWVIDWFYWRRPGPLPSPMDSGSARSTVAPPAAARDALPGAAVGTPAAVSAGSAALTGEVPVYRQEDLEAITGIGPRIGAMLRNNGITTFAELAETPVAELTRIVQSTGQEPEPASLQSWAGQARLAAAEDWAGFAAARDRQAQVTGSSAAAPSTGANQANTPRQS